MKSFYIGTTPLKWIVVTMFYLSALSLQSQVNIKIGYHVAIPSFTENDRILSMFEPSGSRVEQPFGSLKFMHGIQLGLRYKWENVGVELGWENASRDRTALIYNPSTDTFTDRQYNYGFGGYYFGMDSYFNQFGLGSMILLQNLNVDRVVGNNELNLISDTELALRLQFIWQVQESSLVSLMIKPYYQFSLGSYSLAPLANDLGVGGANSFQESPNIFGVSLVFYNGRQ